MPAENMPPGLRSPPARRPSHARDPSDADQASLFVKRKPLAPHHLHKLIIPVPEDEPWRCRSPLSRDVDVVDTVDSPPPPPPKGQASRKPRPVNMLGSLSNVSSASLVSLWTPGTTTATTTTTATEDGPDQARSEKGSGEAEPPSLQALASEPSSADRGRRRRRRDGERVQRRRSSHKDALSDGGLPDSLPAGVKLVDVPLLFEREDIVKLHEQALGQAARFEVLSVKDVDELSKVCCALGTFIRGGEAGGGLADHVIRSCVCSTKSASICGAHSCRCGPADRRCTRARWPVCTRPTWPPCRARR